MKRYMVQNGVLIEDEHGGLIEYIDMIHYQIETAFGDC